MVETVCDPGNLPLVHSLLLLSILVAIGAWFTQSAVGQNVCSRIYPGDNHTLKKVLHTPHVLRLQQGQPCVEITSDNAFTVIAHSTGLKQPSEKAWGAHPLPHGCILGWEKADDAFTIEPRNHGVDQTFKLNLTPKDHVEKSIIYTFCSQARDRVISLLGFVFFGSICAMIVLIFLIISGLGGI